MRLLLLVVLFLVLLVPSAQTSHLSGYWMMIVTDTTFFRNQPFRHFAGPFRTMEDCQAYLEERLDFMEDYTNVRITASECKFTDKVSL